jgi:hypothetical protein
MLRWRAGSPQAPSEHRQPKRVSSPPPSASGRPTYVASGTRHSLSPTLNRSRCGRSTPRSGRPCSKWDRRLAPARPSQVGCSRIGTELVGGPQACLFRVAAREVERAGMAPEGEAQPRPQKRSDSGKRQWVAARLLSRIEEGRRRDPFARTLAEAEAKPRPESPTIQARHRHWPSPLRLPGSPSQP